MIECHVLKFRPKPTKTFCLVCGRELEALHLIIILMAEEPMCTECFSWSGLEMLKRGRK